MVVGSEARPGSGPPPNPPEFTEAVRAMNEARLRPEVLAEPMPAPQRIAPYAAALSADVTVDGNDLSTGRIILLHDPSGNDSWDGTFRCVAYARAEIDLEMITDPALADVGWSWLIEALGAHGASYAAVSGTVTRARTFVQGELTSLDIRNISRGARRARRDFLEQLPPDDAMDRRRRVTIMVEEVGRGVGDGR